MKKKTFLRNDFVITAMTIAYFISKSEVQYMKHFVYHRLFFMWKEIQASEVYHCYQCRDRIKETKSVIPSVYFAF